MVLVFLTGIDQNGKVCKQALGTLKLHSFVLLLFVVDMGVGLVKEGVGGHAG
jgi:hypothetical protein